MTTGITDPFAYHAPSTVREASQSLSRYRGDAKLLAGGHSLIPMMKLRIASPQAIVDLRNVEDLKGITENDDGGISIGAMTTYYELITSDVIRSKARAVAEAASEVADTQVRNWGTIGGSLAHADPAGDLPAVAVALGFEVHAASARSERTISIDRFFRGYLETSLRANEILTGVTVPTQSDGSGCAYVKLANKASHYAIVGVAASVTIDGDGICTAARIGITGAGPHAIRSRRAERILVGKELTENVVNRASQRGGVELAGMFNDDVHASAEYREAMTRVYTARAVTRAVDRAMS
jgi:carbon-monoxide dehydrogenase medium subunit